MRKPGDAGRGTGNYRNLRAWQAGLELVQAIYRLTADFPDDERFGLSSQMRRAAISIPSNLAEGNERGSRADKRRLVVIARGSVAELETQTEIAIKLGFTDAAAAEPIFEHTDAIGRMLTNLCRTLEK